MPTYTASAARAALPSIIDLVVDGHEVTITRHGRPVAVVVSPSLLRSRQAADVLADAVGLHERLQSPPPRTALPDLGMDEAAIEERVQAVHRRRDR